MEVPIPNDRKLFLCQWYFRIGIFFLPLVWIINVFWFFNCAFKKPHFKEQNDIRKYVVYSAFGSIIWLLLISSWIITFQSQRANWIEWSDYISLTIPLGRA